MSEDTGGRATEVAPLAAEPERSLALGDGEDLRTFRSDAAGPVMDIDALGSPGLLAEHVAQELASMRSQLDEALKEHRLRQDRLIGRLLEQAPAAAQPQAAADSNFRAAPAAASSSSSRPQQPAPEAVQQSEALACSSGLAVPPAPQPQLMYASESVASQLSLATADDQANDRATPPTPLRRHTLRKLTIEDPKRVKPTKSNLSLSQKLNQATLAVELSDLLEDMREKLAHRVERAWSMELFGEHLMVRALEGLSKLLTVQEPVRSGRVSGVLRSKRWVFLVTCMIAFNSMYMVFQVDYQARHYKTKVDPPLSMKYIEIGLVFFFIMELVLKLFVHRLYYFINQDWRWNTFDFFLVLISLYDLVIAFWGEGFGGNLTFFRSMRILRMTRVLRVLRVLKFAGQLRRMLLSILGSVSSLFWAFVVLLFALYMVGILTVQSLTSKLTELHTRMPMEEAEEIEADILLYFGSVSSAMLSYYKATSGGEDWSRYYELLSQVSPIDGATLVIVVVFMQIALFNVLTGIFVENAMKVGKPDRDALALEHRREQLREGRALRKFLQDKVDIDSSGTITYDEFKSAAKNPRISAVFASMGLDVRDAAVLFEMMEDGGEEPELGIDFLVDAFLNMKGPATSVDMQFMIYKLDLLRSQVGKLTVLPLPPAVPVPVAAAEAAAPCAPPSDKCAL